MNNEKKKINLWDIKEFEEYFNTEEDEIKLAVYCSILLENWPYKEEDEREWVYNLYKKTIFILRKQYSRYFKDGFQTKPFVVEDKIVICTFLDLLYHLINGRNFYLESIDESFLLFFCLSFDKDVMFRVFRTLEKKKDFTELGNKCLIPTEIFLKLAGSFINLSEFFPDVKNNIYKPILEFSTQGDIYRDFEKHSVEHSKSDVYVNAIYEFYGNDEKFISILRKNAVIILFKMTKNLDKRQLLNDTKEIRTDIEKITKDSQSIDLVETKNVFIEEIGRAPVFSTIEGIFKNAGEEFEGFEVIASYNYRDFLGKYLNYRVNQELEYVMSVERYLILSFLNKIEASKIIPLLELDQDGGLFYSLFISSLKYPDRRDIYIFILFTEIIKSGNSECIKMQLINEMIEKYIFTEKSKTFRSFLEFCYIFLSESEQFQHEFITQERIKLLCDAVVKENNDVNTSKTEISLRILFFIYRSNLENIETFHESRFCSICIDIIKDGKYEDMVVYCFEILTYFVKQDSSIINKMIKLNYIELVCSRTYINFEYGKCLIKLLAVVSNDNNYRNVCIENNVYPKLIDIFRQSNHTKLYKDFEFYKECDHLFKQHHYYVLQHVSYCVDQLNNLKNRFKAKLLTKEDYLNTKELIDFIKDFEDSFKDVKIRREVSMMATQIVDLYVHFCNLQLENQSDVYNVSCYFVRALRVWNSKVFLVKLLGIKLKEVIENIKSSDEIEWRIKGFKLLEAIYEVYSYKNEIKKRDCIVFDDIFSSAFYLFEISVVKYSDGFDNIHGSLFLGYIRICKCRYDNTEEQLENIKKATRYIFYTLMEYAFLYIDLYNSKHSFSYFEMFLNKIIEFTNTKEHISEYKIKLLFNFIPFLTRIMLGRMIKSICLWIKKNNMLQDFDDSYKMIILRVLEKRSWFLQKPDNSKIVVEFISKIKFKDSSQKHTALKILSCFSENISEDIRKIIFNVVKENYYEGCDISFPVLLKDFNFIRYYISRNNFDIFKISYQCSYGIEFIIFLLNYHYEKEKMFNLLCNVLVFLTYRKVKTCRDYYINFVKEMRTTSLFMKKYDFEDHNIPLKEIKISDIEGFIYIEKDTIYSSFYYLLERCKTNDDPVPWNLFIQFSKYCEVRFKKYDLLVDRRVVDLCLLKGEGDDNQAMLVMNKIFENQNDINKMTSFLIKDMKKDLNNINITKYKPFLLKISQDVSCWEIIESDNDMQNIEFQYLLKLAEKYIKCLYIISEIVYNYPRYASQIDFNTIVTLLDVYLNKDSSYLEDRSKKDGAMRILNLISVSFLSGNTMYTNCLIKYIMSVLRRKNSGELCQLIFIICNISVIPPIKNSMLRNDCCNLQNKSFYKRFCTENILDAYIDTIINIDEDKLYNIKSSLEKSAVLVYELGLTSFFKFIYESVNKYIQEKKLSYDNLNVLSRQVLSIDSLLGIAFDTVYNILYLSYEEEYHETGIFNNKICLKENLSNQLDFYMEDDISSDDEISADSNDHDILHHNEYIYNNFVYCSNTFKPSINSIYHRLDIEYKESGSGKDLLLAQSVDETFNILKKYVFDEQYNQPVECLNKCYIKEDHKDSDNVGPKCVFEFNIRKESKIQINIKNETICNLLDSLFKGKLSCKYNVVNTMKMFALFDNSRQLVIKKSLFYLFKFIGDGETFDKIELALELIRLMTCDFEMKEVFTNSKMVFIRCLFYLFRLKKCALKAVKLLDKFEYDSRIFDHTIGIDIRDYTYDVKMNSDMYFLLPSVNLKSNIINDVLKLNEYRVNQSTSRMIKKIQDNVLNGISELSI